MTPQELADHWGIPLRTVQNDCKQNMYPLTYRTTNTSNGTHTGYYISECIKHYPRHVWQALRHKPPRTYTQQEQAAYILVTANDVPLKELASTLQISTVQIRSIYDGLIACGYACGSHNSKESEQRCENCSTNTEPCEPRSTISAQLTRPYQTSLKVQPPKLHTHNIPSV